MKKQKSMRNKGFSLVELIIVIAIMAILVGVLAPNLLKYVERSRVSADTQVADTVRTALMTAMLDPSADAATLPGATGVATSGNITDITKGANNAYGTLVEEILGDTTANVAKKLKSKAYKGQPIMYAINNNEVVITIASNDSTVDSLRIPEATS